MKKIFVFILLLVMGVCLSSTLVMAADWSAYESGRNNISLAGYQEQPGYIAFGDGDGGILGLVWMSSGKGLVWCSVTAGTSAIPSANNGGGSAQSIGAINLRNTKLTDSYGIPISDEYSGTLSGVAY